MNKVKELKNNGEFEKIILVSKMLEEVFKIINDVKLGILPISILDKVRMIDFENMKMDILKRKK